MATVPASFVLREAGPADVDAIMQIESSTFGTDAWSPAVMAADVASAHTHYLVATDPGAPDLLAGYAGLLAPRGSGDADIQTIAVAEPFRRRGLGRMLMVTLIDAARARGAHSVFLEVRADNPTAEALYESLGFDGIAVRPKYYQPDGVDARIMKLSPLPERSSLPEPPPLPEPSSLPEPSPLPEPVEGQAAAL